MKTSKKIYAVITADIVGSRRIDKFRRLRDQKLKPLSKLHEANKLILSPYAITAWDEFQAILSTPTNIPRIILDLRRHFQPMRLWIAIGIGHVTEPYKFPVNIFSGGEAFERAREAVESLGAKGRRFRALTAFNSGKDTFDRIANTVYHLHDSLIYEVSPKQWKTINVQLETKKQDMTAKKLGLDESTVSRNLRRGFYWQMEETRDAMEKIIEACIVHGCTVSYK